MKWFKHHTDSLDDPFIQALMDKFRHVGYTVYFGTIEIIGKEYGQGLTCEKFVFEPTYLRRKLRTSLTKLQQVYDFCATKGKLSVNYSEEEWEFDFPKIVEIKDNYTKDLQAAGKKPSKHKELRSKSKNKEGDREKKEKKKPYGSASKVYLTDKEYDRWAKDFGEEVRAKYIMRLDEYVDTNKKGQNYTDHNKVMRNWLRNDKENAGPGLGDLKDDY